MFEIHDQLKKDCFILGRFKLCYLLLMNDSNYPWFILVPGRENIKDIFELNDEDQLQLIKEVSSISKIISQNFKADKMNIAALGNVVPQLHVHVIARYRHDPAWAGPVWGKVPPQFYSDHEKDEIISKLKNILTAEFKFLLV